MARVLGRAPVDFRPTDLTGLQLWLRADSLSLSDGDPVSTWRDESGQGNDATQGTAASQPTFKTGIKNGKPVVRFDGSDDFLDVADLASMVDGPDQPLSMLIVAKPEDVESPNTAIGWNDTGDSNPLLEVQFNTKDADQFFRYQKRDDAGTLKNPSGGTLTGGSFLIFDARDSGTSVTAERDDTEILSAVDVDVGGLTNNVCTVGAQRRGNTSGSDNFSGDIAELIVYNEEKTSSEMAQLRSYANDKYSIF